MIGIIKRAVGALTFGSRLKSAKNEVEDVIMLTQKLVDKYGDVDDDARRLKIEINEAVLDPETPILPAHRVAYEKARTATTMFNPISLTTPFLISKNVDLIISGENPGPIKIEKANELGIKIISEKDFYKMIQT